LHAVLSTHYPTLYPLFKTKKIITQPQWDELYPPPPRISNIQEFDITLLVILLRNICSLTPPTTGWNVIPGSTDNSREANIVRIRLFRNNFFGHVPGTDVSRLDFEVHWLEVGSALRSLGLNQAEIDRLKAEECGEEEVNRVRQEWNESEKEVVIKLGRMEKNMSKLGAGFEKLSKNIESLKQVKPFSDDILIVSAFMNMTLKTKYNRFIKTTLKALVSGFLIRYQNGYTTNRLIIVPSLFLVKLEWVSLLSPQLHVNVSRNILELAIFSNIIIVGTIIQSFSSSRWQRSYVMSFPNTRKT
jgi:hypothetical protein